MRVVLAPDGFTGTLTSNEAAAALAAGWASAAPGDELRLVPLSDGGPGLVDVLAASLPDARRLDVAVQDPLARTVTAQLLLAGTTAYVESAQACGLHLLAADERDPALTTSYGVGQLVTAALDAGATRVVVGLGGSGMNDGGAGMLAALGVVAVDGEGEPVPPGCAALAGAAGLTGRPDPRLTGVELVAASDVDAPLLGPYGATRVFAPQKGAAEADLPALERALAHWADLLEAGLGVHVRHLPGAGAAGGLGAGLLALGGRRESGVELVARIVGLDGHLDGAGLAVTGEGSFDATSLTGKVVSGVAGVASARAVPCVVLAGRVAVGRREAAARGVEDAYALVDEVGLEAAMADPAGSLRALAARVARSWSRT